MCTGPHPFIPAPGVVNAQIIFDYHLQRVENVFNIVSGGGLLEADLDRIQLKLKAWLDNEWKSIATAAATCSLMVLKDAENFASVGKEYAITPAIAGTQPPPTMPGHCTFAVKWSTGLTGRSHRGRTFHVGLAQNAVFGNQIGSIAQTAFIAAYTALKTRLAAGGTNDVLSVVSYCSEGVWRTTAEVTPITGCSVEQNIDSQRRRLTTRGA